MSTHTAEKNCCKLASLRLVESFVASAFVGLIIGLKKNFLLKLINVFFVLRNEGYCQETISQCCQRTEHTGSNQNRKSSEEQRVTLMINELVINESSLLYDL